MTEVADRAERAADYADRRARDTSRDARWAVTVVLGIIAIVLALMVNLNVQVNGIANAVDQLTVDVAGLVR